MAMAGRCLVEQNYCLEATVNGLARQLFAAAGKTSPIEAVAGKTSPIEIAAPVRTAALT